MKVRAPCEEARSWAGRRWKEGGLLLDPKLEPFTDRSRDCSSATSPSFSPFSSCHKKGVDIFLWGIWSPEQRRAWCTKFFSLINELFCERERQSSPCEKID
jgi:hypothetical protein